MKLRFGLVGGGNGAFIGDVHRHAGMMDNLAVLVAGSFSRHFDKNLEAAELWGLPDKSRVYKDYREMAEKESQREDGIDFVSIATPNSSHYEIAKCFIEHDINIVCDKPLAISVDQAVELQKLAREHDILFGMTYAYTGYPAVRQGREMIRSGKIGKILHVRVAHPEDWVIASVGQKKGAMAGWRFNPEIVGNSLCVGDLGSHAEQLLVQFTGLEIKRVLAMFDTYPEDLPLETNATVLLDLGDGITGQLWASQIAIGRECSPYIFVMGTDGALEWHHETPDILKYTKRNEPMQFMSVGRSYMTEESNSLTRIPYGHHEGFYEAFANIYKQYCEALIAKKEGHAPREYTFPTIDDGVGGQKFISACVESNKKGNVWITL